MRYSLKTFCILLFLVSICSCRKADHNESFQTENTKPRVATGTSLIILGTVQDAGSPHIACRKNCCTELFVHPDKNRKVVSLGVVDVQNRVKYLFEATPDMTAQMKLLKEFSPVNSKETPDGIFLTHAHIGHYTGLMYLGKEGMNAERVPVYAMPLMRTFVQENGPWSQLVSNHNISIQEMKNEATVVLTPNLKIIPFKVPHRDEYSETVGYIIIGPSKSALFIPDIDKWEKWNKSIVAEISKVDYAFVDGSFYNGEEIINRNISEIPHPFIIESMSLFAGLSSAERAKVYFIHMNHTNPGLNQNSIEARHILESGYKIARMYDVFEL